MYQAATTGIKERRSSVIMAWGHRPWLSQTSKHERRCVKATGASNSLQLRSCMLPSFLAEQATRRREAKKTKKRRQPQKKREKGSPRRSRAPQSASRGGPVATSLPHMAPVLVWLQLSVSTPHPAGNRSCCHISAPHGSCPPSGHSCQYLDYLPGPAAVCK